MSYTRFLSMRYYLRSAWVFRGSLQKCTKGKDVVARYGGEEFIILLPDTELEGAVSLAENIRKTIGASRIMLAGTNQVIGRITISCGVAQFKEGEHPEDVIARADAALYAAKEGGRDCVKSEDNFTNSREKIGEPLKISDSNK
ncbi:MAG: diguanylate cyclase [Gammaproteobacteria bacterium]|nr:diguanylate cyclase [Gammaproteobacteria bacterium]